MKGKTIAIPRERSLLILEWTVLAGGLGLLSLYDAYSPVILLALVLLVISFGIRRLRSGHFLTPSGIELPLGLFFASALLSTWAAYDHPLAVLQLVRFLGTAAVFYAVIGAGENLRRLAVCGMAASSTTLAVYFILRTDFSAYTAKFNPLMTVGQWLNAHLPSLPGPEVHPNVAGGALILGIPFTIYLGVKAWGQKRFGQVGLAGLLALISIFGLLLTSSRGAWLGLAGSLGLFLLVWIQRRWLAGGKAAAAYWLILGVLVLAAAGVLLQTGGMDRLLGQVADPTGTLHGRMALWQQSALLARDYPFTGIGLLSFPMIFSAYTLLIHVPYLSHAHNTYLQVLVAQGWPGFIAILGFGLVGLRWTWNLLASSRISPLACAALAALAAAALHGLVDVALYIERTLPLVGVAAGLLAGETLALKPRPVRIRSRVVFAAVLVFIAGGAVFWRPLLSAARANLGAVVQAGHELSAYDPDHFDQPTLDEIRRSADLRAVQAEFLGALRLGPDLTANQRLAGIALSRGQYPEALDWMQDAWQNGARDEVTRLLYGDALVANGQPGEAAKVIADLNWAPARLAFQAFYRYRRLGDLQREADVWRAVVLLDPGNGSAAQHLQDALSAETAQPTKPPAVMPTTPVPISETVPTLTPQPAGTLPPKAEPTISDTPPSPGKYCGTTGQDELLPSLTPPPPATGPAPTRSILPTPVSLDLTQLSQRAGFGMSTSADPETWADQLRSGWFLSWSVMLRPASQLPEHWQTVRLQTDCYYPSQEYIRWVAARYPGLVWIIGNEPDVIWQDNVPPEEYARLYHELYVTIKTTDPSARVAVGAISQATPLRLEYLDRVLRAYQENYAQPLPADWWTVHGYVLREEHNSWGVEIPPGMNVDQGELREVSDHGRMDLFQEQVIAFRTWMAANGYRDTPLALTEFGILMPEEFGYPAQFDVQYLRESFAWLQSSTDEAAGFPADGDHLVQRWAWFSLADRLYPAPDLANLQAGTLTELGQAFRDYVILNKP